MVTNTLSPLLSLGLGNAPGLELRDGVDWSEVFALSEMHGVGPICVDGLQAAEALAELPVLAESPWADEYFQWIGGVMVAEQKHSRQWKTAVRLADALAAEGIKTVVFKGFALGRLYPVPSHRTSSDMDCFLLDGSGRGACEAGNKVAERAGFACDRSYYKDATLTAPGLMVENHRYLLPVRGSRKRKRLEARLEEMLRAAAAGTPVEGMKSGAEARLEPIGGSNLLAPPASFDAIFVLAHAINHFLGKGIMLRHVCDWAMVLKAYAATVDWDWWKELCREYGLLEWGFAMSRLARTLCGVQVPFECEEGREGDERLMREILGQKYDPRKRSKSLQRIALMRGYLTSGWKFRAYTHTNALAYACRSVWGFLFDGS